MFDRNSLLTYWMGDCLRTDKPTRHITSTNVISAFHPSGVGKSSTSRPVCVIPYGRSRSVAIRWVSYEGLYYLTI